MKKSNRRNNKLKNWSQLSYDVTPWPRSVSQAIFFHLIKVFCANMLITLSQNNSMTRARKWELECVCVCVWVFRRERESVCLCVCVRECILWYFYSAFWIYGVGPIFWAANLDLSEIEVSLRRMKITITINKQFLSLTHF